MPLRSVDSAHYHIWTDALQARLLARTARNDWDRGAYVRWCVTSAWTAFEATCESLLGDPGLGIRFRERLDAALDARNFPRPDWSCGLWQNVLRIYQLRKDYTHPGIAQRRLFAPVTEAGDALRVLREAIRDMYDRTGTDVPSWPDDDENLFDPRQYDPVPSRGAMANLTLQHEGSDAPNAVRIAYVILDKEYTSEVFAPGTEHLTIMDELLRRIRIPVTAVRAYRGDQLIDEIRVRMRGSL